MRTSLLLGLLVTLALVPEAMAQAPPCPSGTTATEVSAGEDRPGAEARRPRAIERMARPKAARTLSRKVCIPQDVDLQRRQPSLHTGELPPSQTGAVEPVVSEASVAFAPPAQRLASDGVLNEAFGQGGWAAPFRASEVYDRFRDVVELADGKLLAFGRAYRGRYDYTFARYHADGSPDLAFERGGTAIFNGYSIRVGNADYHSWDRPIGIVARAGGDFLVVGHSQVETPEPVADSLVIYRVTAAGEIDRSFGGTNRPRRTVALPQDGWFWFEEVSAAPDGSIVILGEEEVVRLTPGLTLDTSFGTNGIATVGSQMWAFTHTVLSDGSILLGGQAGNLDRPAVGKLRSNGTWDTSFGTNGRRAVLPPGFVGEGVVTGLLPVPGGIIAPIAVEREGEFDYEYRSAVVRLDATGQIDPSYGTNGVATFGFEQDHGLFRPVRMPDGGVALTGYAWLYHETTDEELARILFARLDAQGRAYGGFGTNGLFQLDVGDTWPEVHGLLIQRSGRLVGVGEATVDPFDRSYGGHGSVLYGVSPQGQIDLGFGEAGRVYRDWGGQVTIPWAVRPMADGRLLVTGYAGEAGFVARYLPGGQLDASFGFGGRIRFGQWWGRAWRPQQVGMLSDGTVLIAGYGSPYGLPQCFALRVPTGDLDPYGYYLEPDVLPFGEGLAWCYDMAVLPDGWAIVAGEAWGGDTGWDMMAVKFRYEAYGGDTEYRYLTPDVRFGNQGQVLVHAEGADYANRVTVRSSGQIMLSGGANVINNPASRDVLVARLNPNGSLDTSFGEGGLFRYDLGGNDFTVGLDVDPQGRTVLAGRTRQTTTEPWAPMLLRLDGAGALDPTFGEGGIARPAFAFAGEGRSLFTHDVRVQQDGKSIVTGFAETPVSPFPRHVVAYRLTEAGAPDPTFGTGGMAMVASPGMTDDVGYRFATTTNGDIVVAGATRAGSFTYYGTVVRFANSVTTSAEVGAGAAPVRLAAFPNPASQQATVLVELGASVEVRVRVHDLLGREVRLVHEGPLPSGSHALPLPTAGLASGVYVVSAETPSGRLTQRLTVLH
jgi:uncharacterized delta-60 repeat protein